ncbi:hypothetical protein AUEXF2481DRAFT_27177 [Aureobasidium subglaciale EXF-2481]|uniref:Zn(2)-C6 fungal-type domain-containing protein n=1 Tax=Aureobasidium subglaciale (strain EXF-2481) TaxID=1043005 RepID=A0A074YUL5_AURSE|nr:uncharacterized protein AUEXF2481DRAFT_27177 [Aureobasidium subglaciale EXF-2481]KAI5197397.1 hypothetical protein E4T38_07991 [Aureobasidium subglaciale]KAI5216323.1 hypothetical protein E4T40_08001 [Aureobasidium subglaciale]KAI5219557.1 hypothetical protein E4T41_07916 [Aureobasidium subglaciale]KAI5257569.1 hypothetical protein E4T46_07892 [Aureobasidium subglaciale]KEQ97827.1 hypothetical protein AUEXF2481DRAFT_27177 [Aureobasidium subglaciale EXF-2481]
MSANSNLSPTQSSEVSLPGQSRLPSALAQPSPLPPARPPVHLSSSTSSASAPATLRDAHGRLLNPRSCVTCRKRKVKCDKLHPCSNCSRAHIECIFPTPGRAPRKSRKVSDPRDAELLDRLRRLEGLVKGLGVDISNPESLPDAAPDSHVEEADFLEPTTSHPTVRTCPNPPDQTQHNKRGDDDDDTQWAAKNRLVDESRSANFETRFGRLVINEGRSRYVNNSFWANLSNEVEDLKGILNQDTDDEADDPSPTHSLPDQHHGWIFSFSSQNVDLLSLHPIAGQIEAYWNVFKERVDPLVKVLHIPTIEPTVLASASHLANLSKSFEALLFAIYYGATTSLSEVDCLNKLGEEKGLLLSRYRFGVEQALARASFLTTEEMMVVQAIVIFLICLRRNNDARVIWTLTGLVVRIAQTLGAHRDGLHFNLPPFEIEMRRRLWWQICILDVRASEDHGSDPTITEQVFDTKMPLNVNDEDLFPAMKKLPEERQGCTDMSFCLIRFEVANTFRRLNYIPPGEPRQCGDFFASVTLEDKERWINECHKRLEERYLRHVDTSVPLYWVTATVARLMMSKMWLMIYHPYQRKDGGKSLSEEVRDKLFITSLENIEYASLMETESRTEKWSWLFKTYMQWHALAFLLGELCHRTSGALVDRAWNSIEKCVQTSWKEAVTKEESRSGRLWKPLMKLLAKARMARSQAIRKNEAIRQATPPGMSPAIPQPHMVRAPLSVAQLSRFMRPPVYGTQPLDSTELMNSPKSLEAVVLSEDSMDISLLAPEIGSSMEQVALPMDTNTGNTPQSAYGSFSSAPYQGPSPQMTAINNYQATNQPMINGDLNMIGNNTTPPGFNNNTTPPGFSPFDPAADIDWQNWDQLVRQFGLEDNAAVVNPANGQSVSWAGNWANGNVSTGGWF